MSSPNDASKSKPSPLSLERLKAAFAQMLSPGGGETKPQSVAGESAIDLHAIVEGILFVGAHENRPRTAEELAEPLRDITPEEVDRAVGELNERYRQDAAAYHIASSPGGYQLVLDDDLSRLRDKFHGRVREATLSPAALEVLSIVAYRQPITPGEIDQLRGVRSGTLLAGLVRRSLVRIDQSDAPAAHYRTTDRFLKLFGLSDVDQLPRAAELD